MKHLGERHFFALYIPTMNLLRKVGHGSGEEDCIYTLSDKKLVHRLISVLRLDSNDTFILFDATHHVTATLLKRQDKQSLTLLLSQKSTHRTLQPEIHWLLPLLKRDAFEQALYTLTEMGATSIQPLLTAKVVRSWGSEKDFLRAHTVMIAAAEQSKQFVIPRILPIIALTDWIVSSDITSTLRIIFDPFGMPLRGMLPHIDGATRIVACAGPEGGFTSNENERFKHLGFMSCALTPTILRASQAVAVGLGVLRSYSRTS